MELPEKFTDKMKGLLKDDYSRYKACLDEERHYALRINTNKISVKDFLKISPFSLEPIPWIDNGFYYEGKSVRPARHPYYFAGLYYLQEPSAMTSADRLPVSPGEKVLDLCAAPGGKATELGAKLKGKGLLVANDISSSRGKSLKKNLELFGIGNMIVVSEKAEKLCKFFSAFFDKILIDAPCSGEGMFRKDKKMVKAWEEHGPEFFSKIQRDLLSKAASMLRPGGMMMYSTCTFDPSENEEIVEGLLKEFPNFSLCPISPYVGFAKGIQESKSSLDLSNCVRIFPHRMKGEGQFLALLKKGGPQEFSPGYPFKKPVQSELPEAFYEFFRNVDIPIDPVRIKMAKGRIYYLPKNLPPMENIRFLRSGLFLGTVKKNRFEPSQALAMYLKKDQYPLVVNLSAKDGRVIKFLKGETLDLSDITNSLQKGWYLLCVDGYPLGFGKLFNGILKNKYPPGWRWMG